MRLPLPAARSVPTPPVSTPFAFGRPPLPPRVGRAARRHARRLRRALSDACGGDVRTAAFLVAFFALAFAASLLLEAA